MNPGSRLGKPLKYEEKRLDFIEYLRINGYYESTIEDAVRYLDKYAVEIQGPEDVLRLFSKVKRAKRHVILGVRLLLNFYETIGYDKVYLDFLRNAIPRVKCGIDLKIPSEDQMVKSLRKLNGAPLRYRALYNLLVDSGLRLVESVSLINSFKDAEKINGFYRCMLGEFRGNKQAYYGHFSETTFNLIKDLGEHLKPKTTAHYYLKVGYVTAKYVRKFCFDKMIELEIPESVADFIQGRVPTRIGARHYMALARQASKFYPRYMKYVENLRTRKI